MTHFRVDKHTVYAVNGVDFTLRRGKTLGIVGESGCGKSVTAHSVLQLLPPTGGIVGGEISYTPAAGAEPILLSSFDRSSKKMRNIRGKEIAMIFQDPMSSLNPVHTIGRQIAENLYAHEKIKPREARERVVALLGRLGLPTPEKRFDHRA